MVGNSGSEQYLLDGIYNQRGHGFNSQSGHNQMVSTRISDCLRTGKQSRQITNIKVNSAFHPSGVGKSSTGLLGWGQSGVCSPVSGGR